jgi:hypothetical protein
MKFTLGDFIQITIFIISLSVFMRKPIPLYLKLFPVYFFCLLILDMVLEFTSDHGIHNNILANNWTILEFSFYSFVLRKIIINVVVNRVILWVNIVFAFFALINIFLIQGYDRINAINFTMSVVITVVFCIYYFFELFKKTETESLIRMPGFWVVCAILVSNVLSFPIFALLSFMNDLTKSNLKTSHIVFDNIDLIFNIISILTYLLYSIGFLGRTRISKSSS